MLGTTLSRPESWRAKHWPVPYLHRRAVSLKGLVFWAVCGVGACVVPHHCPHSVKELLTSYLARQVSVVGAEEPTGRVNHERPRLPLDDADEFIRLDADDHARSPDGRDHS